MCIMLYTYISLHYSYTCTVMGFSSLTNYEEVKEVKKLLHPGVLLVSFAILCCMYIVSSVCACIATMDYSISVYQVKNTQCIYKLNCSCSRVEQSRVTFILFHMTVLHMGHMHVYTTSQNNRCHAHAHDVILNVYVLIWHVKSPTLLQYCYYTCR